MVTKIFKALDIEGDGELSSNEITKAFVKYGVIPNIPEDSKDPKRLEERKQYKIEIDQIIRYVNFGNPENNSISFS